VAQRSWIRRLFGGRDEPAALAPIPQNQPQTLGSEEEVFLAQLVQDLGDGKRRDQAGNKDVLAKLEGLWKSGHERLAIEWMEKLLGVPEVPEGQTATVRAILVERYEQRGELATAVPHLELLIAIDTYALRAHYLLAEHARRREDHERALRHYEAVLGRDVDYPNVRIRVERLRQLTGRSAPVAGETIAAGDVVGVQAGARYRLHRGLPALGPGSWRLAVSSLARPYKHSPAALLAGWLPHGPISTEPLKDTVRRVCDEPWAPHPNYWAMAVDYQNGQRVALGRAGAPRAELPDAVAASCAIPGFFRAVQIGGRRYVDGGLSSASNLDALEHERLDLVVALNPMSSLHAGAPRTLGERMALAIRQASGRRLGNEAKRLRAAGSEVVLIQPTVHDLDVMGSNLMSRSRRHEVIETAARTVREHLRESPIGELLAALPKGQPELVRRPEGSARSWTDFRTLARMRWNDSADAAA